MQGAAFTAQTTKIGRVIGVAAYAQYLLAIALYHYPTAYAAVTTGGFSFDHFLAFYLYLGLTQNCSGQALHRNLTVRPGD
jgi:hypothetical protein